jgi:hypothetical protein
MQSLYHIQQTYLQLMQDLEDNDGILEDGQEELLEVTKENFNEVAENLIMSIKTLEAQVAFAEKEIERINKYKATQQSIIDRFEKVLLTNIQIFGEKDAKKDIYRLEVGSFKLSTRQSKQVIIDEERIDNEWKTVTITDRLSLEELTRISDVLGKEIKAKTDILKTPIKDFLEKGGIVEGAVIQTKYGLTIK